MHELEERRFRHGKHGINCHSHLDERNKSEQCVALEPELLAAFTNNECNPQAHDNGSKYHWSEILWENSFRCSVEDKTNDLVLVQLEQEFVDLFPFRLPGNNDDDDTGELPHEETWKPRLFD